MNPESLCSLDIWIRSLNPQFCRQFGEERGKRTQAGSLATLVFQTVARSFRAILVAITVSPRCRRDSVDDSLGFQPVFRLPLSKNLLPLRLFFHRQLVVCVPDIFRLGDVDYIFGDTLDEIDNLFQTADNDNQVHVQRGTFRISAYRVADRFH